MIFSADMSIVEKILFGLQVALLGLIVVFAALLLIIMMIKLISAIAKMAERKKEQPTAAPVVEAPAAPVVEQPQADQLELIAVITAAVAMMADVPQSAVQIRSIRKVGGSAWARAGRNEQIFNNF